MSDMGAFLLITARHLVRPWRSTLTIPDAPAEPNSKRSASTFTTFDSLSRGEARYFSGEFPLEDQLSGGYVHDWVWAFQGPMHFHDLAHVLIPRFFSEECSVDVAGHDSVRKTTLWNSWEHEQDIQGLSKLLAEAGIEHNLTEHVLEVKRF